MCFWVTNFGGERPACDRQAPAGQVSTRGQIIYLCKTEFWSKYIEFR